jgi:O-antigen/teichoic acid export membrane protein
MGKPKIDMKRYLASPFIKSVITIFTGGAIAQVIPFIVEPILTRIYSPEEFALFAQFVSFTTLFTIVATARYELAIMLPKTERKSINVFALSLIFSMVITIISFLTVLLFRFPIAHFLKNEKLSIFLWLTPIAVLFAGLYQALNYWSLRNKRFGLISISRIVQTTINSGGNILFGLLKWGSKGLIVAFIIGQFTSFFSFLGKFFRSDKRTVKLINKKEMKEMATHYSDFPKINSLHAFTDILQQSLVIFLLSYFFTSDDVGYYSRTFRLLIAPISLIGSSVGQVFFQRASSEYAQGKNIREFVVKNLKMMLWVAIPFLIIISIFAPHIFGWFLGKGWEQAGFYARYISLWLTMSIIISPISTIPLIVGKQKQAFLLSLLGNSLIILSVWTGGYFFKDIKISLMLISSSMFIYFSFVLYWFVKISERKQ